MLRDARTLQHHLRHFGTGRECWRGPKTAHLRIVGVQVHKASEPKSTTKEYMSALGNSYALVTRRFAAMDSAAWRRLSCRIQELLVSQVPTWVRRHVTAGSEGMLREFVKLRGSLLGELSGLQVLEC